MRLTGAALVSALVFLALASPLAADAQQSGRMYRIGILGIMSSPDPDNERLWEAFLVGLRGFGYQEGRNVAFERRYSEGRAERFPELAAELVRLNVDLIVVTTTRAALAAKASTSTIPILFAVATDPVGAGLAESLARPGSNLTGLATLSPELSRKRLQLLKEAVPRLSKVALLWNASNPGNALALRQTEEAARRLGIVLQLHQIVTPDEIPARLASIERQRSDGLFVLADALMYERRREISQFAAKARLPSSFGSKEMVTAGGLMAYGPNYAEMFRRAASYADKLLKGVNPADLPIEQVSDFEFVINLKTARALGLTIPQSLLLQANEVIE